MFKKVEGTKVEAVITEDQTTAVSDTWLATSGFVPTFPDRRDGSDFKVGREEFEMVRKGTVVADEFGELFVVVEITTKVVLCYQYLKQDKPCVYVFNPYQLQEVPKKGNVVDNII